MREEDRRLVEKIFSLSKEDLETYSPSFPDLEEVLGKHHLVRIASIPAPREEAGEAGDESGMEDVLTGLSAQKLPLVFILSSEGNRVIILLGTPDPANRALKNLLKSFFPGIKTADLPGSDKARIRQNFAQFTHGAQIMGTPTNKIRSGGRKPTKGKEPEEKTARTQIEGILRGLSGERWAYVLYAEPLAHPDITSTFNGVAQEINDTRTQFALKGTVEEENRIAAHYLELLEAALEKYRSGKIRGAWSARAFLFTADKPMLDRGISIVVSTFNGEESLPDRIRACPLVKSHREIRYSENHLNSGELAVLTQLPREEFPGFSVRGSQNFGVDQPGEALRHPLVIGEILDRGSSTGNHFTIDAGQVSKHGLIVGVTGSGKTNTCFSLLSQLWGKYKIPFLVIESAKSEYRDLLSHPDFRDCIIFTLGDDTIAPFRLNPFEVPEGILVQSHVDYLKSLFNASFVLYAPMPYVLEESLHEIYEDKGWDLAANRNYRGDGSSRAFPTLTHLYYKIGEVVSRLGYDERISMDVKAGLRARINNLRIGGKGLMLNTRRSLGERDLFERPVILELKQFVNDEEKAFVIGLLLIRLYEYYEAEYRRGKRGSSEPLRHVTLIEEAHRLLKNVSTESPGEESANPKGKSVETFTNILSEIRAYGEGILIAEQIPVKLTPDAIKNSNLKIVQRMVAADDREVMGETINLDDRQKRFITTLQVGEALAFTEGSSKPFMVRIPNFVSSLPSTRTSNQQLKALMERYYRSNEQLLLRFSGCAKCPERYRNCPKISSESEKIIQNTAFTEAFLKLMSSFLHGRALVMSSYRDLVYVIHQLSKIRTREEEAGLVYCSLIHFGELTFEARGDFYSWEYQQVEKFIALFTDMVKILVAGYGTTDTKSLDAALSLPTVSLSDDYARACYRELLPFVSCRLCNKRCLFRYEISTVLREYRLLGENFELAFFKRGIEDTTNVCLRAANLFINNENKVAIRQAALCFAAHKCTDLGLTTTNQEKLSDDIYTEINKKGA